MRNVYKKIQHALGSSGFFLSSSIIHADGPAWFVRENSETGVDTCIRVEFAERLRVLSFGLGWRHKEVRQFCLEALEDSWPAGHEWLVSSRFLLSPCMNYFNFADVMGWELSALPVSDDRRMQSEVLRLCKTLETKQLNDLDLDKLLSIYAADERPFSWLASNSALRLAEIAAICSLKERSGDVFEQSAMRYENLIQSDMFNMGSASSWITALRNRISHGRSLNLVR